MRGVVTAPEVRRLLPAPLVPCDNFTASKSIDSIINAAIAGTGVDSAKQTLAHSCTRMRSSSFLVNCISNTNPESICQIRCLQRSKINDKVSFRVCSSFAYNW